MGVLSSLFTSGATSQTLGQKKTAQTLALP